jgi:two-component system, NtrC family, nitrogen regulation response regulator GlnG
MTLPTVLIADDDRSIRTVLTQALGRSGYQVRSTGNAATLWRWVEDGEGDLVITDVVMPDENGLDLIPRIKRIRPELRVVVMSAQSTLMTAVKATQRGAFEYLPKPFDLRELLSVVGRALAAPSEPTFSPTEAKDTEERLPLIGRSPAMQEIYRTIARLTTADLTVMINGESGTGKELVARALHDYGKRRAGSFVAINMAAIPRELIESELFGHERGAFTGATNRSQGRFEQANGGTLFLDEIGDMPLYLQVKLLRVLQEKQVVRLGSRKAIPVDVRLIAATNVELEAAVEARQFRRDLYYRLNVASVRLPPLRERRGDVLPLAKHFLETYRRQSGFERVSLSQEAETALLAHDWRGNIRELENAIHYGLIMSVSGVLEADDLRLPRVTSARTVSSDDDEEDGVAGDPFDAVGEGLRRLLQSDREAIHQTVERLLLVTAFEHCDRNQVRTAKRLGLSRNIVRAQLKRHGLLEQSSAGGFSSAATEGGVALA